ncbi:MAG: hypothetical protein ACI4EA_09175 [Candidatus Ornithomonoglobus sp.]
MAERKANNDMSAKKDTVMVIIPKPENVVGDTETAVSVNGVIYQIMYDVPVEVPRNVAEVIEQSRKLHAKIKEITDANILRPGKPAMAEL